MAWLPALETVTQLRISYPDFLGNMSKTEGKDGVLWDNWVFWCDSLGFYDEMVSMIAPWTLSYNGRQLW